MIKRLSILITFLVIVPCHAQEIKFIKVIDINTLKEEVIGKDVQLVDIRTPKEYNDGFIDDAININSSDTDVFITACQKLDKEKPIYIYCHSGVRSRRASKKLAKMGFKKIYDFKGGYKAWSTQ